MNGQEKGAEHFDAFTRWAAELSDMDARSMLRGAQLSRAEICRALGCARSVLHQNPRVREALEQLEAGLRTRGVLPAAKVSDAAPLRVAGQVQLAADRERLKQLETDNAALKAANAELRRRLMRLEAVEAHLSATGRLPR